MIHFISGFPRSGTTLLAALLRQNPRFHASIESPVGNLIDAAIEAMSPERNEGASLFSGAQRARILRQIFFGYYEGYPDVVFDTSRRWCAHMGLLDQLFPESKVIACVRDPRAVVDSFERVFARHPTYLSRIIGGEYGSYWGLHRSVSLTPTSRCGSWRDRVRVRCALRGQGC